MDVRIQGDVVRKFVSDVGDVLAHNTSAANVEDLGQILVHGLTKGAVVDRQLAAEVAHPQIPRCLLMVVSGPESPSTHSRCLQNRSVSHPGSQMLLHSESD